MPSIRASINLSGTPQARVMKRSLQPNSASKIKFNSVLISRLLKSKDAWTLKSVKPAVRNGKRNKRQERPGKPKKHKNKPRKKPS